MKKYYLLLICAFFIAIGMSAQTAELKMANGQTLKGTLIDATDTTVIFLVAGEGISQTFTIPAGRIVSGKLPHDGKLLVKDGKIIIQNKEEIKAAKRQNMADNPNFAIGQALKVSGAAAIGIGVPCLVAGLATCIAGNVMYVSRYGMASDLTTKSQLLETSYYLFPIGASLTLVGIPLYVEGKKIMDLNINYNGNGLGLAMKF